LEREAELSGSEVGSEDEDEEGLDRLMVEEGDLDDVDEEAVRDEVCLIYLIFFCLYLELHSLNNGVLPYNIFLLRKSYEVRI